MYITLGDVPVGVAYPLGKESFIEDPREQALRLDTEMFYYLAHRLIDCVGLLPGLKGVECVPIRIVRNNLIEHPQKGNSGVVFPSFSYGFTNGPVVKGVRMNDQTETHPDRGFIPNCNALIEALEERLRQATAEPDSMDAPK